MFLFNLLGTAYGYYWYKNQLIDNWVHGAKWSTLFVPDSPTATLFFVLVLGFILWSKSTSIGNGIRPFIEAMAVMSSIKYGLWAVSILLVGAYQGVELGPIDFMLMGSHLIMVIQVIIYAQLMNYKIISIFTTGCIILFSDYVDYFYGVYPWLSAVLLDDLVQIRNLTVGLSLVSIVFTFYLKRSK